MTSLNPSRGDQSLLRRHQAALGPRGGKGLFSKLSASGGDGGRIGGTFDTWAGRTSTFAQTLRRTPAPRRPCALPQRGNCGRPTSQAKGGISSVARLSRHRYAFLVKSLGTRVVPLSSSHLR